MVNHFQLKFFTLEVVIAPTALPSHPCLVTGHRSLGSTVYCRTIPCNFHVKQLMMRFNSEKLFVEKPQTVELDEARGQISDSRFRKGALVPFRNNAK